MFNNIHLVSFVLILITQLVGFLVLVYFKLNDKNLKGKKGTIGPVGPDGLRGIDGKQPMPFPCPTTQGSECNVLEFKIPELLGKDGDKGIKGPVGISNWDYEETNFHKLRCDGSKKICVNEEVISDAVNDMSVAEARSFWNMPKSYKFTLKCRDIAWGGNDTTIEIKAKGNKGETDWYLIGTSPDRNDTLEKIIENVIDIGILNNIKLKIPDKNQSPSINLEYVKVEEINNSNNTIKTQCPGASNCHDTNNQWWGPDANGSWLIT